MAKCNQYVVPKRKFPYNFDDNVLNLKSEDNCPDETKNQTRIAINDILSTDVFKCNLRYRMTKLVIIIIIMIMIHIASNTTQYMTFQSTMSGQIMLIVNMLWSVDDA